jgi:hypothetical protein
LDLHAHRPITIAIHCQIVSIGLQKTPHLSASLAVHSIGADNKVSGKDTTVSCLNTHTAVVVFDLCDA